MYLFFRSEEVLFIIYNRFAYIKNILQHSDFSKKANIITKEAKHIIFIVKFIHTKSTEVQYC